MATFRHRALNEASMHETGRYFVENGPVSTSFGRNVLDLAICHVRQGLTAPESIAQGM